MMPFTTEDPLLGDIGFIPEAPDLPELEFFRDVLPAGFRRENVFGEALLPKRLRARDPVSAPVPDEVAEGFNPFDDLDERYVPFARSFVNVNSPAEKIEVQNKIDRELEDRRILAAAGFRGFAASMAGGLLDPIILLPVGGIAASAFTKGGGILKGGAATGLAGFLGSSASESVLQAEQETRSFGESAFNISAAALLSGVLGSSAAALSKAEFDRLARETEEILGDGPVAGGMGFREAGIKQKDLVSDVENGTEIIEGKLKKAFGTEKLLSRFLSSPLTRILVRSRSNAARKTLLDLADTPVFLEKNALGESAGPSVESMIRLHTAGLGKATETMDQLFVQMKTGKPGGRSKRTIIQLRDLVGRRDLNDVRDLTRAEFKVEISRTMRRGDRHPIPEVEEAAKVWREEVFDPLKDRAIAAKLLPEDVSPETALSYLTRLYNRQKIEALRGTTSGLEVQSRGWLAARHPELTESQVEDIAEQITDRILGLESGRVLLDQIKFSGAGPLKKRTFLIPDQRIESFLEDDIELIGRAYLRTMAPDVELQTRFGSRDLSSEIDAIKSDYLKLINKAKSNKDRTALSKRRDRDIEDIEAMRDLLRGTYARSGNPDSAFVRVSKGIRQTNLIRLGGGFMVSSLPDIGSIVMAHGVRRIMGDAIIPMIRNFKDFKLAAREVKLTGTAWDMTLDTRGLSLADIGDDFGRTTKFERGLESMSRTFMLANGLSPWNTMMKLVAGVTTQARILRAVTALRAGKIKPRELERLAQSGISAEDGLRIAELFERYGATDRGVRLANTEAWDGSGEISLSGSFTDDAIKDLGGIIKRQPRVETNVVGDRVFITTRKFNEIVEAEGEHGLELNFGRSDLDPDRVENAATVSLVSVPDNLQRRGIGTRFYIEALREVKSRKMGLQGDTVQTPDAIAVWESLKRRGLPVEHTVKGRPFISAENVANIDLDSPTGIIKITDSAARRAREVFRAAVAKEVDTIIVTPGVADKPLWMSTTEGRVIGQFKSFAMSATQRVMLLRLQQRDLATLNGLLLSVGAGMMVYAQKTLQSGKPLSDDPGIWLREGVDRSGVTGFLFDINNMSEKFTRNTIGINALTGGPTASRYASRNVAGALFGPTFGLTQTIGSITGAAATQDVSQSDVKAMRRMVPYQNLFYLDKLFDAAENAVNREFGVPRTKR